MDAARRLPGRAFLLIRMEPNPENCVALPDAPEASRPRDAPSPPVCASSRSNTWPRLPERGSFCRASGTGSFAPALKALPVKGQAHPTSRWPADTRQRREAPTEHRPAGLFCCQGNVAQEPAVDYLRRRWRCVGSIAPVAAGPVLSDSGRGFCCPLVSPAHRCQATLVELLDRPRRQRARASRACSDHCSASPFGIGAGTAVTTRTTSREWPGSRGSSPQR